MLDNEHTIATRWRSATGHLSLLCVGLAGAFIALEILFRVAGLVAGFGRVGPPPAGDHLVVLCVGDSHTSGAAAGAIPRLSPPCWPSARPATA